MVGWWIDRLVVLWIMPPIGFLMTVLQTSALRMFIENHAITALLLAAIIVRWWLRPLPAYAVLHLLLATMLMIAFTGVEWLHYLAGRQTIDNLSDVRMIVYSPFYGSIVIFVLYAAYLTTLDGSERIRHLTFAVKCMCWFHVAFLGYWSLLYFGWVDAIPRADLLHSNSIAYGALFVFCVMLFSRSALVLSKRYISLFLAVNAAVILVNNTRGAIIALLVVLGYQVMGMAQRRARAVAVATLLAGLVAGALTFAAKGDEILVHVLGQDANALGLMLETVADAYEQGSVEVNVAPDLVRDESSLSAFSRIGSNYYSLLSFLDNPFLGIGQAASYSIKVIGSGVHSLHFLIANSTGLIGLVLYGAMLVALLLAQGSVVITRKSGGMLVLFLGYVLVFLNAMPVYFSLLVTLLVRPGVFYHRSSNVSRSPAAMAGGH